MVSQAELEDYLLHFGVIGMHWGIRKQEPTGVGRSGSSTSAIKGLDLFPPETARAFSEVSGSLNKAYGFKIDEVIPEGGLAKYKYIAYVERNNRGSNIIHAKSDPNLPRQIQKLEDRGWLSSSGGHPLQATVSHESCHAMLHVVDFSKPMTVRQKMKAAPRMDAMRKSAWDAAVKQAYKDKAIPPPRKTALGRFFQIDPVGQIKMRVSGYSNSALFIEETEAEMFSAYHYSPNPPKYIDAWMREVHRQMGVDVKPFSGRKVQL